MCWGTSMKKGRKPFTPKKYFHSENNTLIKEFVKLKVHCHNFQRKGYYVRGCRAKKNSEERFHTSTEVEDETPQKNAPEEKEKMKDYYLVSTLSISIITSEDT